MAHILPDTLPQSLPGEVLKTFRALKALPDSYFIWHHLAPWQPETPDFLLITFDGRALLIKVSTASAQQTTVAAQLLLIDENRPPLGKPENDIFNQFLTSLDFPPGADLETLTVFPNIPHAKVTESRIGRPPGEAQWAGKEILQAGANTTWETYLPQRPLDRLLLEKIRHRFSPEVVVCSEMTVRQVPERRREAGLTDYLLDYQQEMAVKNDLTLEPDGQLLSRDFGLNIINGVAGSGKTLILLFRLRLLYHLYPGKRFLVLTHNRPLTRDMEARFNRLEGKLPDNIEWATFFGWCNHHWPQKHIPWVDPLSIAKREEVIKRVWQKYLANTTISEQMFLSEIDWIKDQLPITEENYLSIDRRGRGFGLNLDQRQHIWAAMTAYQQELTQLRKMDWGEVPQQLWKLADEGKFEIPQYDFIFIDEGQFFAPIWMKLIQRALNPQNAHLFVVADPTQGFLGRKTSWKALGLEARGRTHQLRRSYRTTQEIMRFATFFYRSRVADEKDEEVLAPDMLNMPNGAIPQVIYLTSPQDEIARVANEVSEFLKNGCPRKDLLILHANYAGQEALIEAINHRVGKNAAMDPKKTYPGNYVRVTTLNAGAGLESPIVFLVGLRDLFEEEQSLRLADDEREAMIRDNTRKIYMAATRAGQRLVFTYVGELPEAVARLFNG
ncbi:MAG TPA: AAA family ATPase [Anaerolineaceae bacterium]|mgnify:CR=1 FL=1|nr:AAA family ATPase [Anaerolineaceae bacterium]HPN53605.1 AAA family ATPase [Anaerolineaceae bacterium]